MQQVTIEYKGQKITFNSRTEEWSWEHESDPLITKIKSKIDKSLKQEFEHAEAILIRWSDEVKRVTITSRNEDGSFWVRDSKGQREKVAREHVYAATPENESLIAEANKLREQAADLEHKAVIQIKKLKRFNPSDLKPKKTGRAA